MDIDERVNFTEKGTIAKSAEIEIQDVTAQDLNKINRFTLAPLEAEDVFTFKTVIGDNETDDRNYEPFNLNALKDLERLYPGKTIIKDHNRSADNQVARVYDTELITEPRLTKAGEQFAKLIAKNYMVRTASNEDLIKEIRAGIKKEVSTGIRPKKVICNICGTDNAVKWCDHFPGRQYDTPNGKMTCLMTLDGAKEAYELSLVAVPAQPRAGTIKNYGVNPPEEEKIQKDENEIDTPDNESIETVENDPENVENENLNADFTENPQNTDSNTENQHLEPEPAQESENKDLETNLRVRVLESFIFSQNNAISETKGEN